MIYFKGNFLNVNKENFSGSGQTHRLQKIHDAKRHFTLLMGQTVSALQQEAEILHEAVEKQTANEKHYLQSDGTFQAIVFPGDIHYKENDEWKPIDNRLLKRSINKANGFKVFFSDALESGQCQMTVKKGKHKISWMIDETSAGVLAEVEQREAAESTKSGKKAQRKNKEAVIQDLFQENAGAEAKIKYKRASRNTDITYELQPNALKETLTLEKKPEDKNILPPQCLRQSDRVDLSGRNLYLFEKRTG